jgi:membrane-associated phospholipid phosphatase
VVGTFVSRAAVASIVVACSLLTRPCRAHELEWRPEWRRAGLPEYVVTAGALSAYFAVRFVAAKSDEAAWRTPILFDAPVRDALRLQARGARDGTETAADVLEYALLAQSFALDPWLAAGLARRSPDVGWQLFTISAQSHSLAMLLNATTKHLIPRERPYAQACIRDPSYHAACTEHDRFRSFYSSHSSIAATSAGLACSHHTNVRLYGDSVADVAACAGTGLLALSVGALRIVSDEHWASDVITGQLIGFSIGYFLPTLLYYRQRSRAEATTASASAALTLAAAPSPRLLTFAGAF